MYVWYVRIYVSHVCILFYYMLCLYVLYVRLCVMLCMYVLMWVCARVRFIRMYACQVLYGCLSVRSGLVWSGMYVCL